MKEIYIDRPITEIAEDCLGRAEFAQSLANALCNENIKDGYTVGLYGSWGCGKTSLLNIIEKYIEQKQNVKIIHFNPWLCNNSTQMVEQFFIQISDLYREKSEYKKLRDELNVLKTNFRKIVAETALQTLGSIADDNRMPKKKDIIAFLKTFVAKATKSEEKSLLDTKKAIVGELEKSPFKIIVFIDDIDRLHKEEVSEIFRLVKSIADFPNVVYLLSFDREKVVQLLNNVNNSNDGDSYLEKIIQYPIDVPQPSDNAVWSYFNEQLMFCIKNHLDILNEDDNKRMHKLLDKCIINLINNMRDSKRFLNTYSLNISSIGAETNVTDLIGISALQVFAPNVYKRILLFRDNILCRSFSTIIPPNKSSKDQRISEELFIDFLICKGEQADNSSKKDDACRGIIKLLFPTIGEY